MGVSLLRSWDGEGHEWALHRCPKHVDGARFQYVPMPAAPVRMANCTGARGSMKRSVSSSTVSDKPCSPALTGGSTPFK